MTVELYSNRVVALVYGLGLRISQARQAAEYAVTGQMYFNTHYDPENSIFADWEWELFCLFADRVERIWNLSRELDKDLQARAQESQLRAERRELLDAAQACAKWEPRNDRSRIEHGWSPCCFSSASDYARRLLDVVEERTGTLTRNLALNRDLPSFTDWLAIGLLVSNCRDERDIFESVTSNSEYWDGLDWLDFAELERFQPEIRNAQKLEELLAHVSAQKSDVIAPVAPTHPVQREIIQQKCIPTLFPGWFRPEVCFWEAIYQKATWRRPCYDRDRKFLEWKREMEPSRINEAIKNRWNQLSAEERRAISPSRSELIRESQTVKKGVDKAAKDQLSQGRRPF